jgi:CBS domain containing-hemolysin-like protein
MIEHDGLRLKVLKMAGQRIEKVQVEIAGQQAQDQTRESF